MRKGGRVVWLFWGDGWMRKNPTCLMRGGRLCLGSALTRRRRGPRVCWLQSLEHSPTTRITRSMAMPATDWQRRMDDGQAKRGSPGPWPWPGKQQPRSPGVQSQRPAAAYRTGQSQGVKPQGIRELQPLGSMGSFCIAGSHAVGSRGALGYGLAVRQMSTAQDN